MATLMERLTSPKMDENLDISDSRDIFDISDICDQISEIKINYDECQELFDYIEKQIFNKTELKNTQKRYLRYLEGIDIWVIDGVSYEYIYENIITFLNMYEANCGTKELVHLMRIIDMQLKGMLEKHCVM